MANDDGLAFDFLRFIRRNSEDRRRRARRDFRQRRDQFAQETIGLDLRDALQNGKTFRLTEADQIAGFTTAKKAGTIPADMTLEEYVQFKAGGHPRGQLPPEERERRERRREERNARAQERFESLTSSGKRDDTDKERDRFLDTLSEAAREDFDRRDAAIEQANKDRRDRVEERDQLLRDNLDQTRERTDETVQVADAEARRIRADMNRMKQEILSTLQTRNQQFISESTAGVVTGIQSQMRQIDQQLASGRIGQAEASALKNQLRQAAGSQAAEIAGRAMSEFQNLYASTASTLSRQSLEAGQAAANLRITSRVQRQADMASATALAANGLFQSAQLMSVPDRFLSEFDSIINLSTALQTFGGDPFDVDRFREPPEEDPFIGF